MRHAVACLSILLLAVTAGSTLAQRRAPAAGTPVYGYRLVRTYPHDPGSFTQGLAYADGYLYEGSGMYGRSSLRKVELQTGKVIKSVPLSAQHFGEGVTVLGGRVFQLTWKSQIGFVYDLSTFRLLRSFSCPFEGWGLTTDGKHLIMSDGSATLRVFDPDGFRQVSSIHVSDRGTPVTSLNELEFVEGEIYANVWHSDRIARISPFNGSVIAWIDLSRLVKQAGVSDPEAVLNGIAYDAARKRLFVTGKLWPHVYEIRLTLGHS